MPDIFLSKGSFTCGTNGSDTPASGTSQTWAGCTVTNLTDINGNRASNTATPSRQLRFVDAADASATPEIIIVTNDNGTGTLTVTRGAEGTATVAHANGATFKQVLTSGSLTALARSVKVFDVTAAPYNAVADCALTGATTGSTDQTTAFQNATTDAIAAGGGIIFVPTPTNGKCYRVDGTVTWPYRDSTTTSPVSIVYAGDAPPVNWFSAPGSTQFDLQPSTTGSILRSTKATSGSVFTATSGAHGESNLWVAWHDLILRLPSNPVCNAIDATNLSAFWIQDSLIDVPLSTGSTVQPTTAGTTGVKFPTVNCIGPNGGRRFGIEGFDQGVLLSEHVSLDEWMVQKCNIGIAVDAGFHASDLGHALVAWCPTGIKATQSSAPLLRLSTINFEETGTGAWTDPVWHVDDTGNVLRLTGVIHRVTAGTGVVTTPPFLNGASGVNLVSGAFGANIVATSGAAQTLPDTYVSDRSRITLTAATVGITLPWPRAGRDLIVELVQDATGSRTAKWFNPGGILAWAGGTAPTLTTTAAAVDVVRFSCTNGTDWIGSVVGLNVKQDTAVGGAGLLAWFDASTLGLADGTSVSSFTDSSGHGSHAVQATGGSQPVFHTAVQNGLGAVLFSGGQYMDSPAVDSGTYQTLFAVVHQTASEGIMNQDESTQFRCWQFRYNTATKHRMLAFNSVGTLVEEDNSTTITSGAWCIVSAVRKPGSLEVWTNGVSGDGPSSTTGRPRSGATRIRIGTASTTSDNLLSGHIGELRVYTYAMTTAQRRAIEAALSTKWNITVT